MAIQSARRSLATILAALALAACAAGCASPVDGRRGDAAQGADATERPEYRLGYQLRWQGFPRVTSRRGIQFFNVLGDTLVVQDHDNALTVLETDTGRNRWSAIVGDDLDNFVGNARARNRLLVSQDISVTHFDIATGELLDVQRLAYLANTPPLIVDALAIYGCTTGEVLAHNLSSGFRQWAYGLAGTIIAEPVRLAGPDVAAVSDAGGVVIIDARQATAKGRLTDIFDGIDNDPVADELAVYVASRDQSVYAFARANGARLWRYRTASPITAQPTVHDGTLYVHVPGEGMIALDTRSGRRLWANPDVDGRVVAMRAGRLIAWNGDAFTTLDAAGGETIETIPFPDVQRLAFDGFVDADLYTISRAGVTRKYSPF